MNLQQLDYVLAVDKLKSFTKAAEACHVTQATLSAMIKKLEEELGVILFDRKSNPVITTESGRLVVEEARKVVLHSRLLTDKARGLSGKIEGHIRLGIIPTIANALLPRIIKPILEQFPDLSFEISEITTANIVRQLKEGSLDLGILSTPLADSALDYRLLYYESLMVYGQVDADKKYLIPDDIRQHRIWMLEEGHCLRAQMVNLCSLKKTEKYRDHLQFEASSFETLINMVDAFGGLTLIPELYYLSLSEEKKKRVSFFEMPLPVREVSLVYHRPYAKLHLIEALEHFITRQIGHLLISREVDTTELKITAI
jgi:LysR family hydrogen peroxide-inducible transcriptional activator